MLNLNGVLADTGKMLRRLMREDIELSVLSDSALGLIRADRGQIEQVIMNLVINARDAMPAGGRLTLTCSNVVLDEKHAQLHPGVRPGLYVRLTISDTGYGMDAETRSHIFEPFFTTKEQGRGTGLGLATVQSIVEQASGHIVVESESGKGTSFHIYLPCVEGAVTEERRRVVAQPARGTETVLVVEDLEGLRILVCDILRNNGYKVLAAENGRQALLLAKEYRGRIELLITDMVMPEMGGREVAQAILESGRDVKLLFMSGYADKTVDRDEWVIPGHGFIHKPFHPEALLRKIREVLDTPPESGHSA
jgi:two-component system, cell cycle sensor histidine kinase and response regulator CckA